VAGLEQTVAQTAVWALDRDRQVSRVAEACQPPDEPVEAVATVRDGVTPPLRAVVAVDRDRMVRGGPSRSLRTSFLLSGRGWGRLVFGEAMRRCPKHPGWSLTGALRRVPLLPVRLGAVGGGGVVLALEGVLD
jgi:hypothetical protein